MATPSLEAAEDALLLADLRKAERLSRAVLEARGAGQASASCRDRAAIVLLQSLQEAGRFSSAKGCLATAFGSLEACPPNTLLLWLSLALDTEHKNEAQALIFRLLQQQAACQGLEHGAAPQPSSSSSSSTSSAAGAAAGGAGSAWSRRQWLTLLHLYLFEVLVLELGELSEVQRWLRETDLPLSARERGTLAAELDRLLPSGARAWSPATKGARVRQVSEPRAVMVPRRPQALTFGGAAAAAAGGSFGSNLERASVASSGGGESSASWREGAISELPGAQLAAGGGGGDEPGVQLSRESAAATALQLGFLGRCQRQLLLLLRSLCAALLSLAPSSGRGAGSCCSGGGGAGSSSGLRAQQAVLGGVLGLVLAYSAYAERRALAGAVRRARQAALQALADLGAMALSLTLNPMAAT